jgi:hypothetical protein
MTLQERERELQALDMDAEGAALIVAEIDTARLYLLSDAIKLELAQRCDGKPLDKLMFH